MCLISLKGIKYFYIIITQKGKKINEEREICFKIPLSGERGIYFGGKNF